MEITLNHYMVLSALLFCIGLYGTLSRRNAVAVLIVIEIMLNSVNLALVGMSRYVGERGLVAGQIFAVFIITVAAAEAAVALAMLIAIYRARGTINIDDINLMRW